jgi:hypothetical protein
VRDAAASLEDVAKAGNLDGAEAPLAALRAELSKLEHAFVAARLARGSRPSKPRARIAARRPKARGRSRRS